jgi:large subunit ribosomal protein L30e
MAINDDIKDAVKNKKLLIGTRETIKNMKSGNLKKVIYSSNLPEDTKRDLNHHVSLSKIELEEFKGDSKKLGETCGKPFAILIMGIRR